MDRTGILDEMIDDAENTRYHAPMRISASRGGDADKSVSIAQSIMSRSVSPREYHRRLLEEQRDRQRKETDDLMKQNIENALEREIERREKEVREMEYIARSDIINAHHNSLFLPASRSPIHQSFTHFSLVYSLRFSLLSVCFACIRILYWCPFAF